uniref:Uncharacterized protein n=1 Tax=Oryza meridionalis TaxID=40149 RepID=A0A0E0E282_9ORYZ
MFARENLPIKSGRIYLGQPKLVEGFYPLDLLFPFSLNQSVKLGIKMIGEDHRHHRQL